MSSILYQFATDVERDAFDKAVQAMTVSPSVAAGLPAAVSKTLDPLLADEQFRPVALFVDGAKAKEGPLGELRREFAKLAESDNLHLELKEQLRDKQWRTIQIRRKQKLTPGRPTFS